MAASMSRLSLSPHCNSSKFCSLISPKHTTKSSILGMVRRKSPSCCISIKIDFISDRTDSLLVLRRQEARVAEKGSLMNRQDSLSIWVWQSERNLFLRFTRTSSSCLQANISADILDMKTTGTSFILTIKPSKYSKAWERVQASWAWIRCQETKRERACISKMKDSSIGIDLQESRWESLYLETIVSLSWKRMRRSGVFLVFFTYFFFYDCLNSPSAFLKANLHRSLNVFDDFIDDFLAPSFYCCQKVKSLCGSLLQKGTECYQHRVRILLVSSSSSSNEACRESAFLKQSQEGFQNRGIGYWDSIKSKEALVYRFYLFLSGL